RPPAANLALRPDKENHNALGDVQAHVLCNHFEAWGAICDTFGGTSEPSTRLPQPPRQDVLTFVLRGELDDYQHGRRKGTFQGRFRLPSGLERAASRSKAREGRRDDYTVETTSNATPFTCVVTPFVALVKTLPYCLPPEVTACWILCLTLLQVLGPVASFFFPSRPAPARETTGVQRLWNRPPAYPSRPGRGSTPPKRRHAFIARRRLASVFSGRKEGVQPVLNNESLVETTSAYAFAAMLPYVLPVPPGIGICGILFLHLTVLALSLSTPDPEPARHPAQEVDFWGRITHAGVLAELTPASPLGLTMALTTTVFLSSLTCCETWVCVVLAYALGFLAFQLTTDSLRPTSVEATGPGIDTASLYMLACISPSVCIWSPTSWLLSLSLVHLIGLMHLLTYAEPSEVRASDATSDPPSTDVSRRLLPFSADQTTSEHGPADEPSVDALSTYALACLCSLVLSSSVPAKTLSWVLIHFGLLMWYLTVPDGSTPRTRSTAPVTSAPVTSATPVVSKPPAAANATARRRNARHHAASSSRTRDDLTRAECTKTTPVESPSGLPSEGESAEGLNFSDDDMEEVDSDQTTSQPTLDPQSGGTAGHAAAPPVRNSQVTTSGIVLDFRNNAVSRLSRATADLSLGSTGSHPDWTPAHYLVALGPEDADTVCILRRHVRVYSSGADVLCVHDLLSADGLEILRPYESWHGALRTVQGSVLHLQPAYDAPVKGVPSGDLIHLKRCVSPLDASQRDPPDTYTAERIVANWMGIHPQWIAWAANAGPDDEPPTSLDDVPRYDRSVTMRLRLAGISEWEHQERIRFHPPGSEDRLASFLTPTPCTNPSSGPPAFCPPPWMGITDPLRAGEGNDAPPTPVNVRSRILRYPAAALAPPVGATAEPIATVATPTPSSSAPGPRSLPPPDVTPGDTTMVDTSPTSPSLTQAERLSRSLPPIPRVASGPTLEAGLPLSTGATPLPEKGHVYGSGGKAPSTGTSKTPLGATGGSPSGAAARDPAGVGTPSMNPPATSPPPANQAPGSEEASDPTPLYTIVLDPRCGVGSRFSHQVLTEHVIHTANPLPHNRMSDDYCQLQLGSFAGDTLGVYYTSDNEPGTVTRLSINDLLASDAARITGGTPDGPNWRGSLILASGAELPLRPARAEDYPGPVDISAFRCVDIYEHKDCDMVDAHVIQTKWTSPDPDWAALGDESKTSSDLAPFSTEVRSRLRDAGITAVEHFEHLRRRDWLNVLPESFPIVKLGHPTPTASAVGVATSSSSLLLRDSDGASACSSKRSRRGGSQTAGPAKRSQYRSSREPAAPAAPLPVNRSPVPVADQEGADIPYSALGHGSPSANGSDHVEMENDYEDFVDFVFIKQDCRCQPMPSPS
ncbi:hypothetical protein T484DRAFT_3631340, partial [Baffinella frigidus]